MAKASSCTKVMMTLHSSLLIHCSESILHLPEVASAVLCEAISCQLSAAAELPTVWIPRFSRNNFPPLFCADAVRSLLCVAACGPTTANSYIRCFWNVILKNLHNTLRSCLGFEERVIWVIVWFDSLNSRAHSRESSKTCAVWYFENAISENYSLLNYDAA